MSGRIASALGSVTPPRRSTVRNALIAALVIVALLAGITATVPFLVEGEAAKTAIERRLAELTGGEFRYEGMEFHVWPRPTADLRRITFRLAPIVEGTAERATLRFAFLPLLKGEFHVSRLDLDKPSVVVQVPAFGARSAIEDPVAAYRAAIDPALDWLALHAGGLKLSIRDGVAEVHKAGEAPLKLDSLTLDGAVSDDSVEAKIAARGTSWKHARASMSVVTASRAGNLELTVDDLDAERMLVPLLGTSTLRLHPAPTDATIVVQTDGQRSATASLSVSTSALAVARGVPPVQLGAVRARLKGSYAPGDSSLTVDELTIGDWLANGTGSLKVKHGVGGTVLEAKAGRIDAARARAVVLAIAQDTPAVTAVTAIVKAGHVLDVTVAAAGNDLKALADFAAYDMSMDVEKASFDVPVPPIELTGTSGKLRVAKNALTAHNVAATFGASKLSRGELVLALAPAVALRSLTTAVDLDLAETHPRVRYLSRDSPLGATLDRIESITGRATGTISLREEDGRLREMYDMANVNGTLRYSGVPLPIMIERGRFSVDPRGAIVMRGVDGAVGASRINALDAEIALAPVATVRSAAGTATLMLDEIAPPILASPPLRNMRADVSSVQGVIDVKVARMAGALNTPERIDISATVTPRNVRIATPRLVERLRLDGGTMRLEGADLFFDTVDAEMQDSRGVLSGAVRAYATPARTFDVAIARATIGPRSLGRLEDEAGMGPAARLRAPLTLDRARIRWPLPAPWFIEGSAAASFRNGGRAEVDWVSGSGSINVRRLTLKDQDSDARVVVDWQPDRAIVGFHGVVSARSIARMIAMPPAASGTLRGDFDATVDLHDLALSKASGKLEGTDMVLPTTFSIPVAISRLSVDANGDQLRVRDSALRLGDQPIQVAGTVGRATGRLNVDATIGTEGIDAAQWLDRLGAEPKGPARAAPWWQSLSGKVALRAQHLDLHGYRMEPFVASVTLGGDKVIADVTEARVCGLAMPLKLTASGGGIELEGQVTAEGVPLAQAAKCLSRGRFDASGAMDVRASFTASGPPSSLVASTRGSAKLRARDGRIGGVHALSRVVQVDEVSQRLSKAEIESAREGFAFSVLEIDASLAGERVTIERALVESPALNVAMQGEVRFDNGQVALTGVALPIVSSILKRVPVIGQVVGDPVVGIPISVTGSISDPQVNRVGAGAIAGALVGVLQSVVSLPVQLLGGPAPAASDSR